MRKLIKFLIFYNLSFELISKYNIIVQFSNNFKAEIYRSYNGEWHGRALYQDSLLFETFTAKDLKAIKKRILFLKSCLNIYDFDSDCSGKLLYIR